MLVLHANWTQEGLIIWGESSETYAAARVEALSLYETNGGKGRGTEEGVEHPFAAARKELKAGCAALLGTEAGEALQEREVRLRLPMDERGVCASDSLRNAVGAEDEGSVAVLEEVKLRGLLVPARETARLVAGMREVRGEVECGPSVLYWQEVVDFALELVECQRFVPTAAPQRDGGVRAQWQAWLEDGDVQERAKLLVSQMPTVCRGAEGLSDPAALIEQALHEMVDAVVREALTAEDFGEAIEGADGEDAHVGLLSGLLCEGSTCKADGSAGVNIARGVGQWLARLDTGRETRRGRLCLRLEEPAAARGSEGGVRAVKDGWELKFFLQPTDDETKLVAAEDIWSGASSAALVGGEGQEQGSELLLGELARAARMYVKLEESLREAAPTGLKLTTAEAHEFLKETSPVLEEAGIGVIVPEWWTENRVEIGLRLVVEAKEVVKGGVGGGGSGLGIQALVRYTWQVAVGDRALTREDVLAMKKAGATLIRVNGQWVEVEKEALEAAAKELERGEGGEMTLLEAMRTAYGEGGERKGLKVSGLEARGWVAEFLGMGGGVVKMEAMKQPGGFVGELRPYQQRGLSWLAFLDSLGFGACLADDMGLGKTIQLIAMLLHERAEGGGKETRENGGPGRSVDPTLLVVPTSVVVNWTRELERFAPSLRVHVQHGPERPSGAGFLKALGGKDVCVTTYPLVSRDAETLQQVRWRRVVLDEAQYIKNPPTKQATAIRTLNTRGRIALTGTPVENRLSELWSIMEFCNPGYLGNSTDFRRRFALPIERHRDAGRTQSLKHLVRPFVLRRLKSDPTVIDDLPACLETKEFATLTPEQAGLYEEVVRALVSRVEQAEGMQRRGMVLAALVRLKQICDHPELMASGGASLPEAGEAEESWEAEEHARLVRVEGAKKLSMRSGKAQRLMVLLDEVLASDGRALVFTQFRQMGHLLSAMLQRELGQEALFLHGGTPTAKRQAMIDRFQSAEGGVGVFILSLRAGGLGLNLTAANHVFHYDRWWNPAVEAQATDRAYRIGQTRTVHVHKFVCSGTLEERIDQMIEQKTELARNIIGAGEQWLTELSTGQLRDLLMLKQGAVEGET